MKPTIRWPVEAIRAAIEPQLPGFTVEILPSIDSTNSELMRRAWAPAACPGNWLRRNSTGTRP